MAPNNVALAKVTVIAPVRRIDVALPEDVPLSELLPTLLEHAGENAADDGDRHGGWVLRRTTGTALDPGRALNVQGVQDGETLRLAPARQQWPELEYDDVVEAMASGARRYGRSWSRNATRRAGLAVFAVCCALGLAVLLVSGAPWALPGDVALAAAVVLVAAGSALARALPDVAAGAVLAGCGLPYAFFGGLVVAGSAHATLASGFGAPHLLLGSSCLLTAAVAGYTGVGSSRIFAAGIMTGLLGAVGGLIGLTSIAPAGTAAIMLAAALAMMPGYPLLSIRLGRVPVPQLPQHPLDLLKDNRRVPRSEVFDAVARADEILSGLLLGVAIASVPCVLVLLDGGQWSGVALTLDGAVALLLRARLFPTVRQRVPLIAAGLAALAVPVVALAVGASNATRAVLVLTALVVAAFVVTSGMVFSRRAPSPYLGRAADVVDVVAIIALLPLAAIIAGLFSYVQNVFASAV